MSDSDYLYIERFIVLIALLWLWLLFKLYLDYNFSIWLLAFLVSAYWIIVVLVISLLERKIFNKKDQKNYEDMYASKSTIEKTEAKVMIEKKYIDISDKLSLIQTLREMDPKYFEDFIALLFTLKWYIIVSRAKRVKYFWKRKPKADWWIDMIVSKDDKKTYVQIKKKQNHQLEETVVRDFYWAIVDKKNEQEKGIIIITSIFSDPAIEFAKEKDIKMVDYKILLEEIEEIAKDHKQEIEYFVNMHNNINSTYKFNEYAKTCPRCLAPLVWRKKWSFYGCMNYHKTVCNYREK